MRVRAKFKHVIAKAGLEIPVCGNLDKACKLRIWLSSPHGLLIYVAVKLAKNQSPHSDSQSREKEWGRDSVKRALRSRESFIVHNLRRGRQQLRCRRLRNCRYRDPQCFIDRFHVMHRQATDLIGR